MAESTSNAVAEGTIQAKKVEGTSNTAERTSNSMEEGTSIDAEKGTRYAGGRVYYYRKKVE